ncbi:uncharacterized protein DUF4031 [Micromonospora sp. M71_S20]|uniref:DUF4031 domain-containing protein n=1 Tax=Micromonospora sp. M71_S20 TaxID=592872 RepID=UPI000F1F4EFF|nr:uncharacterized protein DUF4031 [Micromonospora sp. M71_S20]
MLYLDRPAWPWRGRLWSHLISDVSPAELHAFAETLGVPRRGFDRDHYDIPADRFAMAVWLGARVVPSRELVRLLREAGLRRPKHLSRPRPDPPPTPAPPTPPCVDHAVVVPRESREGALLAHHNSMIDARGREGAGQGGG